MVMLVVVVLGLVIVVVVLVSVIVVVVEVVVGGVVVVVFRVASDQIWDTEQFTGIKLQKKNTEFLTHIQNHLQKKYGDLQT